MILIADDNNTTQFLLKKLIEKMGLKAEVANDGIEAWEKINAKSFRLIITDWMMPNLDGIGLCRKIRESEFKDYIYIILLTGKTDEGDIVDGLDSGADDYIKKPFNKDELKARIRSGMRIIKLHDEKEKAYLQMLESSKLAAIGNLSEGISHEINTPTQYIVNNTSFLEDSFKECSTILNEYGKLLNAAKKVEDLKEIVDSIENNLENLDIEYLMKEVPLAIKQNLSGLSEISKIVESIKSFAKPGVDEISVDINREIENTITVSKNKWKKVSEIQTSYDNSLPLINCFPGELNQVFLNLITNAVHAIEDKKYENKGLIRIATKKHNDLCLIYVKDNGTGIPKDIQSQIFDPFFTTKEVGRGVGQGLAISKSVITEKHGGSITFETGHDKGTTFIIKLPLHQEN